MVGAAGLGRRPGAHGPATVLLQHQGHQHWRPLRLPRPRGRLRRQGPHRPLQVRLEASCPPLTLAEEPGSTACLLLGLVATTPRPQFPRVHSKVEGQHPAPCRQQRWALIWALSPGVTEGDSRSKLHVPVLWAGRAVPTPALRAPHRQGQGPGPRAWASAGDVGPTPSPLQITQPPRHALGFGACSVPSAGTLSLSLHPDLHRGRVKPRQHRGSPPSRGQSHSQRPTPDPSTVADGPARGRFSGSPGGLLPVELRLRDLSGKFSAEWKAMWAGRGAPRQADLSGRSRRSARACQGSAGTALPHLHLGVGELSSPRRAQTSAPRVPTRPPAQPVPPPSPAWTSSVRGPCCPHPRRSRCSDKPRRCRRRFTAHSPARRLLGHSPAHRRGASPGPCRAGGGRLWALLQGH